MIMARGLLRSVASCLADHEADGTRLFSSLCCGACCGAMRMSVHRLVGFECSQRAYRLPEGMVGVSARGHERRQLAHVRKDLHGSHSVMAAIHHGPTRGPLSNEVDLPTIVVGLLQGTLLIAPIDRAWCADEACDQHKSCAPWNASGLFAARPNLPCCG
jgi:hypothetical protein